MRKEDFVMSLLAAQKVTEHEPEGKTPKEVLFKELLEKAENKEEFVKQFREGKAFKLEEKAGIHVISLGTDKPPIIQVKFIMTWGT